VRIPSWLEADPSLRREAVYIEADRFFHQKILLAIRRRTIHSDPISARDAERNEVWKHTKLRASKYLNNLIEQDHRGIKSRTGPMLGFKRFDYAAIAIAGVELLRRIHKGQFALGHLRLKEQAAPAIWNAVLAA
jgi:transposase-like protein